MVDVAVAEHQAVAPAPRRARAAAAAARARRRRCLSSRAGRCRTPAGAARAHEHGGALPDVGRDAPRSALRPAAAAPATAAAAAAARPARAGATAAAARRAGRAEQARAAAPRPGAHRRRPHRPGPARPASRAPPAAAAPARPPARHSGGPAMPSSASGVTTSVTSGIATRLAAKPTSEICWKNTMRQRREAERWRRPACARPTRSAAAAHGRASRAGGAARLARGRLRAPSAGPPRRTTARSPAAAGPTGRAA